MKLYRRKDNGRWVGTQGETNGSRNRIEETVPTDKPGLLAFLNDRLRDSNEYEPEPPKPVEGLTLDDFETWLHIQPVEQMEEPAWETESKSAQRAWETKCRLLALVVTYREYQAELAADVKEVS